MPRLSRLGSSAVIRVADELVERYTAQGWVSAEKPQEPKPDELTEPKRGPGRPKKSEEK